MISHKDVAVAGARFQFSATCDQNPAAPRFQHAPRCLGSLTRAPSRPSSCAPLMYEIFSSCVSSSDLSLCLGPYSGPYLANATPTFIFRNREGDAPCPVPIVCIGWPLPQFGVPHSVQCSREQIASQLFQNSVVIPL